MRLLAALALLLLVPWLRAAMRRALRRGTGLLEELRRTWQ
jgi:hypothetical protein